MILTITPIGRPAPQGSKRRGSAGQLREQSTYLPAWRRAIKIATYRSLLTAGILPAQLPLWRGVPVYVHEMTFHVGDGQCRADGTGEPIGSPDVDKLARAALDGLGVDARLFADDAQVVDFLIGPRKVRQDPGLFPGATIKIGDEIWENE